MTILALDASTPNGQAAILQNRKIKTILPFEGGRSHSIGAATALEKLAPLYTVDAVVVGTGPGSYTGLRSSIAAAWGFASARGIPLCGVPSILALDYGSYLAIGDARAGQYYLAKIVDGHFASPPALHSRQELLEILQQQPSLPRLVPAPSSIPREQIASPRLEILASLARWEIPQPCSLPKICLPIYLKPPSVTTPRKPPPTAPGVHSPHPPRPQ